MVVKVKAEPFFGGIPTDADIRRIRDAYPDDELKDQIATKEEIAAIIDVKADSHRFRTVTHRWRRVVFAETNKIIGLLQGVFHVLDDKEKVDLACSKQRAALKSVRRSVKVSAVVDRKQLSEEDQRRLENADKFANRIGEVMRLKTVTDIKPKKLGPAEDDK